jgi:hypothetical protein
MCLYETAVDRLCAWEVDGKRVRPKVVASTATIRRAPDQVHSLFMRDIEIFPPQGTDVRDNFFSRQREPSEEYPGRRYLGICAPGKCLKAALFRVYVAHLAAAQKLYEKYGKAADPWMTLVGYFNSMRELGGMRRLVDDDVSLRLQSTESRGLADRKAPSVEELTSRRSSADIPRILDRLETAFDPAQEKLRRAGKSKDRSFPLDVLLATNMISVGVDVSRLGSMVVAGQPKTTAEYIQATSRVGRSAPGLVCTVFNWARARDLSHYERFEHYHATFYQYVEAFRWLRRREGLGRHPGKTRRLIATVRRRSPGSERPRMGGLLTPGVRGANRGFPPATRGSSNGLQRIHHRRGLRRATARGAGAGGLHPHRLPGRLQRCRRVPP